MKILTYPARPSTGGPLPQALAAGGYDLGCRWFFEPKVNGWRAMLHTPTGAMFNRHGKLLSIADQFRDAVDLLLLREVPFEWLDVEAIERRHGIGCGSLIVLDGIARETLTYNQRRLVLRRFLPWSATPSSVSLIPSLSRREAEGAWLTLQSINFDLDCIYYEGVVAKRGDSIYPLQLRSDSEETRSWVKHRFTTK